jgi:hypothetical protein
LVNGTGEPLTQKIVRDDLQRVAPRANAHDGAYTCCDTCSACTWRCGTAGESESEARRESNVSTTERYMHRSPAAIDGAIRLLVHAKPPVGLETL